MMKNILGWLFLTCLLAVSLCACGNKKVESENAFQVYYLSSNETKVVAKAYELQSTQTMAQIGEILAKLSENSEKLEYKAPLSMGFSIKNVEIEEGKVLLDMDENYLKLSATTEVLVRAALVKTITQLPQVSHVGFTVNGNQLFDNAGELVGWMTGEQFINNDGNEINTYELARVKLYFADETGEKLIANYRENHYSTNTPLERLVVEELIAGPSGQLEGVYPSVNPETKIINIMTKDGICYVNLDSNFLTVVNNVSTEVSIYSLVNSLVELNNISKVQVLINGEVPESFSASIYERNLDYVTVLKP